MYSLKIKIGTNLIVFFCLTLLLNAFCIDSEFDEVPIYDPTYMKLFKEGKTLDSRKIIESYGVTPGYQDVDGNTMLHLAVYYGEKDYVSFLLKKKIDDVNSQNNIGNTPLHLAAQRGVYRVIRQLLESGARTEIINNFGNKPHQVAFNNSNIVLGAFLFADYCVSALDCTNIYLEE